MEEQEVVAEPKGNVREGFALPLWHLLDGGIYVPKEQKQEVEGIAPEVGKANKGKWDIRSVTIVRALTKLGLRNQTEKPRYLIRPTKPGRLRW